MEIAALEKYIHENLPLTKAMGVKIQEMTDAHLRLGVPLALNLNHKRTAFGGSLESLATITCWATIYVDLKRRGHSPELVIRRCSMRFLHAVECDFSAVTAFPSDETREAFLKGLTRRGIGRIAATSVIEAEGKVCAEFEGEFVAVGK